MPKRRLKLTPPDPDEDQLQASIVNLLHAILISEQVRWTHIAHGGYELSKAARGRLFRLGLQRGFPDLVICYAPGMTLWLEIKTATGCLSPAQRAVHLSLRAMSHNVVIVRRIEDVIKALIEYRVPFRQTRLDGEWYATNVTSQAPGAAEEPAEGHGSGGGVPASQAVG